jgi:hypothetical protein
VAAEANGLRHNPFLKTSSHNQETRTAFGGCLMSRGLGGRNDYELHMIHNVRPAVELPGSSRRTALVICGILIASAVLALIVLRS